MLLSLLRSTVTQLVLLAVSLGVASVTAAEAGAALASSSVNATNATEDTEDSEAEWLNGTFSDRDLDWGEIGGNLSWTAPADIRLLWGSRGECGFHTPRSALLAPGFVPPPTN
jgi:hypothetical protein